MEQYMMYYIISRHTSVIKVAMHHANLIAFFISNFTQIHVFGKIYIDDCINNLNHPFKMQMLRYCEGKNSKMYLLLDVYHKPFN